MEVQGVAHLARDLADTVLEHVPDVGVGRLRGRDRLFFELELFGLLDVGLGRKVGLGGEVDRGRLLDGCLVVGGLLGGRLLRSNGLRRRGRRRRGRRRRARSTAAISERASASAIPRRSASSAAMPSRPLPTTRVKRHTLASAIARFVSPSTLR